MEAIYHLASRAAWEGAPGEDYRADSLDSEGFIHCSYGRQVAWAAYRFIPPFRSTFWCKLGRRVVLRQLRKKLGVVRWQFAGLEHLRASLAQDAGVLLTPNHCRWADPMLMGALGIQVKRYLYYIASY